MLDRVVIVVPTIRPDSLREFLARWADFVSGRLVVVADGEASVAYVLRNICHEAGCVATVCEERQSPVSGLFARSTSGVRSLGFYKATQLFPAAEYIWTLDDDCYPHGDPVAMLTAHIEALQPAASVQSTTPPSHVRGLPYRSKLRIPSLVNVGLWEHVPDLDGVHQLVAEYDGLSRWQGTPEETGYAIPHYVPMCGMNLCFRVDALPLMFFAPMGEDEPFHRFEDIWCGWLAQRVLQEVGAPLTYGPPCVWHSRASDALKNMAQEAAGILFNEKFFDTVAEYRFSRLAPMTSELPLRIQLAVCMRHLAADMAHGDFERDDYTATESQYIRRYGEKLHAWLDLIGSD